MAPTQNRSRSLPEKPSAEYLRKQAKDLARGEAIQLAAAQRRLAREYGYRNWSELIRHVQSLSAGYKATREADKATGPTLEEAGQAKSLWKRAVAHLPLDHLLDNVQYDSGQARSGTASCPENVHQLWRDWTTRGWFEWETGGYPWWSNLHNVQSWWDFRHLPNILFVHYADLLADLEGEIRRVAHFLEIEVPDRSWPAIVQNSTFTEMRAFEEKNEEPLRLAFKDGARTFFHKGSNGRWREILSPEELGLYDAAARRELTLECRRWLENGGRPQ